MKVLILAKRFPPEAMATAILTKELAQEMSRHGWQVTVAAGYPHHPYGRLFPGYEKKWISFEEMDGFRLLRSWHFVHPSRALPVRTLMDLSKSLAYLIGAHNIDCPDVVISFEAEFVTGPLTAYFIARRCRAKTVHIIFDIFSESLETYGMVTSPFLLSLVQRFEKLAYRYSDKIVVLSEGFRRILLDEKAVAPEKMMVIPVWLDARDVIPMDRDNPWRREMGIPPEKFVILHAGTLGYASGAEVIIETARLMASNPDILFLIVGDGSAKEHINTLAQSRKLTNVNFLPFQPRERLSELQATADISLVTLVPGKGKSSVPSKILGYMAAARPVIASVDLDCDTAELVGLSGCGLVIPPGRPEALAQAILYYYQHPRERAAAGQKGHKYFLQNLEKKAVLRNYIELIENLVRQ